MNNKHTVIASSKCVDIATAISDVIKRTHYQTQKDKVNYELVYNDWFVLPVTPETTLQYGLNLFFTKAMLRRDIGIKR